MHAKAFIGGGAIVAMTAANPIHSPTGSLMDTNAVPKTTNREIHKSLITGGPIQRHNKPSTGDQPTLTYTMVPANPGKTVAFPDFPTKDPAHRYKHKHAVIQDQPTLTYTMVPANPGQTVAFPEFPTKDPAKNHKMPLITDQPPLTYTMVPANPGKTVAVPELPTPKHKKSFIAGGPGMTYTMGPKLDTTSTVSAHYTTGPMRSTFETVYTTDPTSTSI